MTVAADPARTYAFVVGVERYDTGAAWHLDGPAADASRFVSWLLSRGVPASQILLFLSPLAESPLAQAPASRSPRLALRSSGLPRGPRASTFVLRAAHPSAMPSRTR